MAELTPEIETMENRYMRAWAQGELAVLKSLTARRFNLLIGSKPAVMLDCPSWLEAATKRFICTGYRFGDIYVRDLGPVAIFATQVDLKATLDRGGVSFSRIDAETGRSEDGTLAPRDGPDGRAEWTWFVRNTGPSSEPETRQRIELDQAAGSVFVTIHEPEENR